MCLFLERRPEGTYSKFSATPTRADIHGVLLIKLKATMHSNVHSNVHTGSDLQVEVQLLVPPGKHLEIFSSNPASNKPILHQLAPLLLLGLSSARSKPRGKLSRALPWRRPKRRHSLRGCSGRGSHRRRRSTWRRSWRRRTRSRRTPTKASRRHARRFTRRRARVARPSTARRREERAALL